MGYAYMNQSCSCPSQPAQPFATQTSMTQTVPPSPSQPQVSASTNAYSCYCPNTSPGALEQYPVGMGYVPWQQWQQTYSLEQGFNRGTIFPDLDLPFVMGRCVRS